MAGTIPGSEVKALFLATLSVGTWRLNLTRGLPQKGST
jgi:hypothetical protein